MIVSVYIPTKNRVRTLVYAVESVLAQEFKDFELIIVDDGSSDDTQEYLRCISNVDMRIRVIRNESASGAQVARNMAIRSASGYFVTGLDDDDRFHPMRLGSLLDSWSIYSKYDANICGLYSQDIVTCDGKPTVLSKKVGSIGYDDFPIANSIGNQIFAPKQYVEAVGLYDIDMPAWQDMELFIRLVKRYGQAKLVDLHLYYYDNSANGCRISANESKIRTACQLVIDKHYPDNLRHQQSFWLQVFSSYYGFKPSLKDFVDFHRKGFWPVGLGVLAMRAFRNAVSKRYRLGYKY